MAELTCSEEIEVRHRTLAHDFPCAALFLQTQRLIPLELCNSKRCSFAITTPYLTMVLTCFHGIELLPLEGPRGSDLANRLGGWSLSISTSPLPLSWLCLKARRELLVAVKFHPSGRGRAGVPASPLASRESRYGGPLESPTCAP